MKNHKTKNIIALTIAICIFVGLPISANAVNSHPFTDVTSNYYHEFVDFVYEQGIMTGTSTSDPTIFSPNLSFSRSMLVMALYKSEGQPSISYSNPYTDISDSDWYYDAILWATKNNIVTGYNDDEFKPNLAITREQFVTMIYRFVKEIYGSEHLENYGNISNYQDSDEVSSWARDAMNWAVGNNLVTGVTATTLVPSAAATRIQASVLLTRLFRDFLNTLDSNDKKYTVTIKVYGSDNDTTSFGEVALPNGTVIKPKESQTIEVSHGNSVSLELKSIPLETSKNITYVDYVSVNTQRTYYGFKVQDATYTLANIKSDKEIIVYFSITGMMGTSFTFGNTASAFGQSSSYKIPLERYQQMYPYEIAQSLYDKQPNNWTGKCFGMVSASAMITKSEYSNITSASFSSDLSYVLPDNIKLSDVSSLAYTTTPQHKNLSLLEFIECLHIAQKSAIIQNHAEKNFIIPSGQTSQKLQQFYDAVKHYQETGEDPLLLLGIFGPQRGHAMLAFGIGNPPDPNMEYIWLYDPDCPHNSEARLEVFYDDSRTIQTDYTLADTLQIWELNYISLQNILEMWENRGNLDIVNGKQLALSYVDSQNFDIVTAAGASIEVRDGRMVNSDVDGAILIKNYGYPTDDDSNPEIAVQRGVAMWIPFDTYTFTPMATESSPINISLARDYYRIDSEITPGATVTINITDNDILNHHATVNGEEGDAYSVKFSYAEISGAEFDDFIVSGTMKKDELKVQKCAEGLEITGAATIDSQRLDFNQTVIQNPGIIPIEESVILDGRTAQVLSGGMEQLATPSKLMFGSDEVASWGNVANATGYQVRLYLDDEPVGVWIDVSNTEYNFESVVAESGAYYFAVLAVGDGIAYANSPIALYSEPTHLLITLEPPENLAFSYGVATWNAVENAMEYQVLLYKNGLRVGNWITAQDCNHYFGASLTDSFAEYTFAVVAVGDGITYKNSSATVLEKDVNFTPQLSSPENLRFGQGIAMWDAVANVSDYYVTLYYNDESIKVIRTSSLSVDFTPYTTEYGVYYYELKAIGDGVLYKTSESVVSPKYYNLPPLTGTSAYIITVTQSEGGTISPGTSTYLSNTTTTFTITPDDSYKLTDVFVDGDSVGAVTEYMFSDISKPHSISAVFQKSEWKNPFVDVADSDWFYSSVQFVHENSIMYGADQIHFSPVNPTTRGMVVTILHRMEGLPVVKASHAFEDVLLSAYYSDAVSWAVANEIITGYDSSFFGPEDNITREQLATILCRYAAYLGIDVGASNKSSPFSDDDSVSLYAKPSVAWAVGAGVVQGRTAGTICPKDTATRGEVATMIMRFLLLLERDAL